MKEVVGVCVCVCVYTCDIEQLIDLIAFRLIVTVLFNQKLYSLLILVCLKLNVIICTQFKF